MAGETVFYRSLMPLSGGGWLEMVLDVSKKVSSLRDHYSSAKRQLLRLNVLPILAGILAITLAVSFSSCVTLSREPALLPEDEDAVSNLLAPAVVVSDLSMHEDAMNLIWRPDYHVPMDLNELKRLAPVSTNNDLIQGTLYQYKDTAYFVFTGTHHLSALLATVLGGLKKWKCTGGFVHEGILKPFETWVGSGEPSRLVELSRSMGIQKFVLVGYSQGGALAVMMGRWLKEEFGTTSTVVTLNSVRTFKADFVTEFEELHLSAVNYVYRNDPVSEFSFGKEWVLPGKTRVLDGPRGGFAIIDDHFLDHFFMLVDSDYRFHYPEQVTRAPDGLN